MEYTKQTWIAPTGTGLSRYAKSAESASHVTLTLDPENLTNTPTPFTMARMAHMEDGIAKAYDTAPPTPWAQYSGKDIPQLPDNVAGTTQKVTEFTSASVPAGWTTSNAPSFELVGTKLKIIATERYSQIIRSIINLTSCVTIEEISGQWLYGDKIAVVGNNVSYKTSGTTVLYCNTESGYVVLSAIYIGTGAYDRLVFDNSYHYRHLLNNAVIPTPQGLYFNGTTSYLRSKEPVTLPDVFTFSATVNCAVKSFDQVFFAQGTTAIPTNPFIVVFRIANTENLSILTSNGISRVVAFLASNFFTGLDNTDIKIEISVDFINKTTKVYRNGIQFGSVVSSPTMVKPVTDYIYFGDHVTGNNNLLGYMRNICLFDTALTDTQRNWLAQGNTPPILYDVTNYELGNANKANVRVSLRHGDTFFNKTWTGLTDFVGERIWTDGDNIYYSYTTEQFVLNKSTSAWVAKTWAGLTDFNGSSIWTDGENIYSSNGTAHYVLNKSTSTWTAKTWSGLTDFIGYYIWTDGNNIYYSNSSSQFILNKATSTWTAKTWSGLTDFIGSSIWTDGENIYSSNGTAHYVLNKSTSTWTAKTWSGLTDFIGYRIWTDGDNIYYSYTTEQFVLNKSTSAWVVKTWTDITSFTGVYIWADGDNIYYSNGTAHRVLPATRHNYIDDAKYNSLFGTVTTCSCSTLSNRFVFRNE